MSVDVVHLVVGPEQHGVVRHAVGVAHACGHRLVRSSTVTQLPTLEPCDVVHLAWTDRLFAADLTGAAAAFDDVARRVRECGAALSVTLHDVPHDASELQRRRRELYAHVVAAAHGVVVNSGVELGLVEALARPDGAAAIAGVHSLRRIGLPVADRASRPAGREPAGATGVAVLGFVYPDRGYEDVIDALPSGATLTAVGRASDGHEDLPGRLAELARQAGARWRLTGYVSDDQLPGLLGDAQVPVAPNRRVTASASIDTWLAHGRRPLVPDSPYGRELSAGRPGAVQLYDPDEPGALAAAIAHALDDPASTYLADGVPLGPTFDDVAAAYLAHLDACGPPLVRRGHAVVVSDNRWDLLDGAQARTPPPKVSVIVPYFEAQSQLDLALTALAAQTRPDGCTEVVVVDDGSARPPDVTAAGSLRTLVLRQDDLGFRAARARNLGAAAATGEILVFLDGDMLPEPTFLQRLVRLPASCPDVLTVGRRRHADLTGVTPDDLFGWRSGGSTLLELDEPAWLSDAYRMSGNLLRTDRRSYRYVISALLAVHRDLFAAAGGFDESFVGYGGEDWDFAHRARNAGALLAHVPDAVAWHDGPDWAGRGDATSRRTDKEQEKRRLDRALPDPDSRGPAVPWSYPSVVVRCGATTADRARLLVRAALDSGADCGFWFEAITDEGRADHDDAGPGIRVGSPPVDVLARAWCQVWLPPDAGAPASTLLTDLGRLTELAESADRHGRIDLPSMTLRSTRSVRRSERWTAARPDPGHSDPGSADALADRLFGRHDRTGAPAP